MKFAKWSYLVAGIYGVIVLLPQYLLEDKIGRDYPPPITHPEHFYGFIGAALAWQIVFLIVSRNPARYRPIMIASIVEKYSFGIATIALYIQGRLAAATLTFGLIDSILGTLFLISYWKTRNSAATF